MKRPGEVLNIRIPAILIKVTVPALLILAVAVLTYLYAVYPEWRQTITFLGIASGVAGTILSAFYVGHNLKESIDQREYAMREAKVTRALTLASRWNDPLFRRNRRDWRPLLATLKGKSDEEVVAIIRNDPKNADLVAEVLNFLEEVGFNGKIKYDDMDTLRGLFRSLVLGYYAAIEAWITEQQGEQETAYEHFKWLRNQWKS